MIPKYPGVDCAKCANREWNSVAKTYCCTAKKIHCEGRDEVPCSKYDEGERK